MLRSFVPEQFFLDSKQLVSSIPPHGRSLKLLEPERRSTMKSKLSSLTCMAAILLLAPVCVADSNNQSKVLKQQERYTLSLELEFSKKQQNPLEQAISVLFDVGPNGYATGFLVGNGLVMTAYHVISGNLSTTKKVMLGFKASDDLAVVYLCHGRDLETGAGEEDLVGGVEFGTAHVSLVGRHPELLFGQLHHRVTGYALQDIGRCGGCYQATLT